MVDFAYQKYWEDAPERRTVGPLLLKEFRGRRYVLATMVVSGRLACFGLDRISDFSVTAQRFTPPAGVDAHTYFADYFGITRPTDGPGPQEILLRFMPVQGRYALSYPLHSSQQVVMETMRKPACTDRRRHPRAAHGAAQLRPRCGDAGPGQFTGVGATGARSGRAPLRGQNYLASASPIFFKMRLGWV
ncbi:hypothetical protein DDQ68_02410 [Hymenobacter nivis]|uniref:WYL domain-containing protein n=1 Tax=Hymenobacter nivis TaxID=1850093 RepID=A0A2Z3GKS4_9BACT|nr:WYL domain-containing protein [Hymenobacter nivis]AWM31736.1 hypothetical protein DDQ68_02410 [Hymenobacter nivis]